MAAQIVAALIFIVMFALIIWEQIERHIVALVSGCLMFILVFGICMHSTEAMWQTLNLQGIFTAEFWYDPHGLA
ncbi:MAG: citrate transporter, partial [Butyricicoccus sp.]